MPLLLLLGAAGFLALMASKTQPAGPVTMAQKRAFVDRLRPIAARIERAGGIAADGTSAGARVLPGIKADLLVIQTAHESDWGRSGLTAASNNLAGMTAEEGTYWRSRGLPFVMRETTEYTPSGVAFKTTRPFRRYPSWEASLLDLARRIQRPDFVVVNAAAIAGDLRAFAAALQAAKYASDPKYAAKLTGLELPA